MIAELTLALAAMLPQGSAGSEDPRSLLDYPEQPELVTFAPFVDANGVPLPRTTHAADTADIDGDENPDAWFLAGPAGATQLSVQLSRTSSLGRFRDGHVYAGANWVAAATFRSTSFSRDRVLLADPSQAYLAAAYYYLQQPTDPPRSGSYTISSFAFSVGNGAFEVATHADADGHDDVLVLRDLGSGQFELRKLRVGAAQMVQSEVAIAVPFPLASLRALDVDADGRSDAVTAVPGAGVVVFRDQGDGTFALWAFLPIASPLEDLFVGDADGDGRDDLGVVLRAGIAAYLSRPTGLHPQAALLPIAALRSGGFSDVDADGIVDVFGVGTDGRTITQWFASGPATWDRREVRAPCEPSDYLGNGPLGLVSVLADVDNDGDRDLLLQLPSGALWHALVNPGHEPLLPESIETTSLGPVGETGFYKQRIRVRMPARLAQQNISDLEFGVYLEDPNLAPPEFIYWGRRIPAIDPVTHTAEILIYYQTDQNQAKTMIRLRQSDVYADGITAAGNVVLSIHGKRGTRRLGSVLLHHDGSGDGHKSAKGVRWQSRAAPPKPSVDAELLPWD